jgi:hypothetical protein
MALATDRVWRNGAPPDLSRFIVPLPAAGLHAFVDGLAKPGA